MYLTIFIVLEHPKKASPMSKMGILECNVKLLMLKLENVANVYNVLRVFFDLLGAAPLT